MNRKIRHALNGLCALQTIALAACSSGNGHERGGGDYNEPESHGGFDGIDVSASPLLAAGCTITGSAMTVTVKDGESALISLRTLDSVVTVNGNVFTGPDGGAGSGTDSGRPCEVPLATGTINVVAETTGGTYTYGRGVVLDYINGLFALGTSAAPGIKIDFTLTADTTAGAKNSLRVRGSDGVDLIAIGAGTATPAVPLLNVNARYSGSTTNDAGVITAVDAGVTGSQTGGTGGVTVTTDQLADVSLKNVGNIMIATGAGDDRIDGSGGAGTGLPYTGVLQLFGNDGADTVTGGSNNDVLTGGLGADVLSGCAGNDTYVMGAAPAGADVIAQSCPITIAVGGEGLDTVDYSARSGALQVNLSATLTAANSSTDTPASGETSGDGAHISDKIATVKLGKGDDAITMTNSTVTHKVTGGPGDDSFTGSGKAADTFDGEAGDDTCIGVNAVMDYSLRTAPVTATLCGTSCTADNNDGDQSSGNTVHTGTGATTVAGGGLDLATIVVTNSKFTATSVGNSVALTCPTGVNTASFPIIEFVDANTVKLDVTGTATTAETCTAFTETLAGGGTNTGTTATLAAKVTTGKVTITDRTLNAGLVGHTLVLTRSAESAFTGDAGVGLPDAGAGADEGSFLVIKVTGTTAFVDDSAQPLTGVSGVNWAELGAERDNVQCTTVAGGTGNDIITGDSRANVIRGGAGNDIINGGAGSDSLNGQAGTDSIYGGAGDDTIVGGSEVDTIFGGDGNDVLTGDSGADVFSCDGKNASTDTVIGTAPGENDILGDFSIATAGETKTADCEFF